MVESEDPERKQPKTITAEAYPEALWSYILDLARAGVEELQDKPRAAETDGSRTFDYMQIPLGVTANHLARTKRFTASLPKALLPLQCENWSEDTALAETMERMLFPTHITLATSALL